MVRFFYLMFTLILVSSCGSKSVEDDSENAEKLELSINIPAKGNSWVVNNTAANASMITESGIQNWKDLEAIVRTYFKTDVSGKLHVGLNANVPNGTSKIKITVGNQTKNIELKSSEKTTIDVGIFDIKDGYNFIEIEGIEKSGDYVANIKDIAIGGPATKGNVYFIKDDFYFGRRGPSVHLSYKTPENKDVVWFYNEINVPKNEDIIGSYFMANGFKDGYFGIQVNSETERRILFSVWSPYETQNPDEIPDDYKIILLGKGDGVTSGEFGNEGSGGQSYKVFDWKAGNTYKFLLKGEPSVNNSTDYTAYFFAPEENEWKLIASFRRPYTNRYLQNLYSFLENFMTETGYISRKGNYKNQWAYTKDGIWTELVTAKFTADATARKESRLDYAGGVEGNTFFMKNCGFFSEITPIDSEFTREANGTAPAIDFSQLPVPK
ncbi:DUF3472 domain-containing protein [Aureibaculum sp. 2210JD6-5]|uniref:DUF3472 domain-containing protein n=1 Tax=Aureibaculum sp. 2210JD6-5 TaxID=3103957 RepID=UPI002AADE4B3|nr:DUF3472 domain-containing protein [Aureibaculum sp. 2210JD6-5]MDY7394594.1 DUF3472 domain-containing protein [Aureibaculum sp. 2210JD6-5]